MDIDTDLLINFIPIISTASITLITCITVFYKLRKRWPVKVNCWFCNGYSKIDRKSIDWWLCQHCDQYNGFSRDGDYRYHIPEQHKKITKNEKNNSYCQQKVFSSFSQNNLCKKCSKNEELKLFKLRELECSMDASEEQLSQFEKSFDKKYPLCLKCQNSVKNVLSKQSKWLTEYKMLLFKQKSVKRMIKHRESIESVLHIILSILASVSIYFSEVWYFPLSGIILQLAACLASAAGRKRLNIFPVFGWICLFCIETFSISAVLSVLNLNSRKNLLHINDDSYDYFLFTLATAIGLMNLRSQFFKSSYQGTFSLKKLDSSKTFTSSSHSSSSVPATPLMQSIHEVEPLKNSSTPVNITDTLMSSSAIETPIPVKAASTTDWYFGNSLNSSQTITSGVLNSETESGIFSTNYTSKSLIFTPETQVSFGNLSTHSFKNESLFSKNLNTRNSLSDSLTSLNSLSLGSHKKSASNSPKVFETKVYGTGSSNLFSRSYSHRRSILAPAKLNSVSQTSWVAGGYWQSNYDLPLGSTLSRSSSQSSGFGSSSSNIGPSQEPTTDFDQCSILSDQFSFARPESQLSSRTSASTITFGNKAIHSLKQCSLMNSSSGETESLQCHLKNNNIYCTGHTTVISNPVWLPALLCASLVFNILVLWTVLLR